MAGADKFAESMRVLHETAAQGVETIRRWAVDIRALGDEEDRGDIGTAN